MVLSLHELCVVFDACAKALFDEKAKLTKGNEIFELSQTSEGVEKVTMESIDALFEVIHPFWDQTQCEIPSTYHMEHCMKYSDDERKRRLSKMSSAGGQQAWANFEAKKMHEVMSAANRYSKRNSRHKSCKMNILKELFRRHKPDPDGSQEVNFTTFCVTMAPDN